MDRLGDEGDVELESRRCWSLLAILGYIFCYNLQVDMKFKIYKYDNKE